MLNLLPEISKIKDVCKITNELKFNPLNSFQRKQHAHLESEISLFYNQIIIN